MLENNSPAQTGTASLWSQKPTLHLAMSRSSDMGPANTLGPSVLIYQQFMDDLHGVQAEVPAPFLGKHAWKAGKGTPVPSTAQDTSRIPLE